jgi:cobalamin biosynthesis protein CobT
MTGEAAMLSMNVVANVIGKMRGITIKWHNGTAIDCDPFKKVLRIPRVSCASMLDSTSLMLLRGMVYHEAGHLMLTKLDKAQWPKGALMEIWNAVEDRWMERGVADKFPGAAIALPEMSRHYNEKIAKQILIEGVDAPLWEGLCAMGFMSNGIVPAWRLTPKADAYYDAGYATFIKWKKCKSSKGTLKVAQELYDLLKDVNDSMKQNQPEDQGQGQPEQSQEQESQEQGGQEQGGQEQGQQQQQDGEQEGEPQSGGAKDFDDYENDEGEKEQGGEPQSGGKDEQGDSEGDSEEDKDSEGSESDSAGKSDSEDGEGDEADKEGSEGAGKGKGDNDDGEESDDKSDSSDEFTPGGTYNPVADGTDGSGDGDGDSRDTKEKTWEEIAQQELESGKNMNESINEELADMLTEMAQDSEVYTARRDKDIHNIPLGNKQAYQSERQNVSGSVMTLTRALDQALRVLSKSRVNRGLRRGRFDSRRLVHAATGLSKNVFYKTSQGITLDTVVSIVIDESGSMGNIHEVRRLVIAIGEALTKIGVDFEIVGTTTKYIQGDSQLRNMDGFDRTNPIVYRHYKIFGENWANVAQRTTAMRASNHNVDGETVEYAAQRLEGRKEARKVVFSICDGEPFAGHYNEHMMAKNLRDVCKNIRNKGMEVYGFGLGTYGPRAYYGADNFIFLEDGSAMGPEFVKQFSSIITGGRVKVGQSK